MITQGGRFAAPAMAAISLLLFAAPALADTRHAAPTAMGLGDCSDPDNACDLPTAVSGAGVGDVVQLATGTYTLSSTIELANGVDLQGTSATDATVLNSTATVAVRVTENSPDSRIQSLTINHAPVAGPPTIALEQRNGTVEQTIVKTSTSSYACFLGGGIQDPLLRNSVCDNSANSGIAVGSFNAVDTGGQLVGVTALASSGYALYAGATATGADVVLNARNVIANGASSDQGGNAVAGSSILIDLDFSNFDFIAPGAFNGAGSIQGTDVEQFTNQSDPPLLDSTYHQMGGSPTINSGESVLQNLGTIDFETDPRIQGAEIDIGADEAEGEAPDTFINQKPPKRTRKRSASFRFSTSDPGAIDFECKLDGKPFKDCDIGTIRYKNLTRRKHTFQVRSTDEFFNTDATPAKYSWTVKKKRKRR